MNLPNFFTWDSLFRPALELSAELFIPLALGTWLLALALRQMLIWGTGLRERNGHVQSDDGGGVWHPASDVGHAASGQSDVSDSATAHDGHCANRADIGAPVAPLKHTNRPAGAVSAQSRRAFCGKLPPAFGGKQ
jgi:hypothetical protein